MGHPPFRVGFVTGATPDKWARIWRERRPERLELVPLQEVEQEEALRSGVCDMALVREPIGRDGLHLIPLYEELPVVVAGVDHLVAAAEGEVSTEDLVDDQLVRPHPSGWTPAVDQLPWPPMSEAEAIEVVASGTGIVILPMAVARLYARKDVVSRKVAELEPTRVGLAWLVDRDDDRVQAFIGIVRGRSANSSRG